LKPRSFRARLLAGAILWTVGLLPLAHLFMMSILPRATWLMRIDHHHMVLGAVLVMFLGYLVLHGTVTSLAQLRARLASVSEGRASRIGGEYPTEIQALVDELNALLAEREQQVARAVAKAGDLAHGLKTPLALLLQESEQSPHVAQQVERMRRQIDYHLAHARAAASGATLGARTSIREPAEALARTMLRLHAARGLAIEVDVAPEHAFRGEREDLDEMLGNLLDNACKWARSHVTVSSSREADRVVIHVDDDGAGIEPSMRDRVLQRGVRADEAAPGSGFGLAIVRDLAEVYGGSIALDHSSIGGVRATLRLPSAD
jgi:signal transduction histidine kinase